MPMSRRVSTIPVSKAVTGLTVDTLPWLESDLHRYISSSHADDTSITAVRLRKEEICWLILHVSTLGSETGIDPP